MALQNSYNLSLRPTNAKSNDYASTILPVATFDSCDGFWSAFSRCPRPDATTTPVDTHIFKTGIQPIWEDEANRRGGKWIVRIPKGLAGHYWEQVVLSIIGEQFDVGNEICGAVLSVRFSEDSIAVWNRHASNIDALHKIRDSLYRILKLPPICVIDYKPHDKSLHEIAPARLAALNGNRSGRLRNNRGSGGNSRFNRATRTNERNRGGALRSPDRSVGGSGTSAPRSPRNNERRDRGDNERRDRDAPVHTRAPEGRWR
jgi:translation initiation factor 4E